MKCGYCPKPAIAWMEWRTIGRRKGAPVCEVHVAEFNKPDNNGEYPKFSVLTQRPTKLTRQGLGGLIAAYLRQLGYTVDSIESEGSYAGPVPATVLYLPNHADNEAADSLQIAIEYAE